MVADVRIAIGAFAMALASCNVSPSCRNEPHGRSVSPNGKMAAIVYSRNCGATTGDNYQISIVPADEAPTGTGNALILDSGPSYSPHFKPMWHGDGALTIPVPAGARVFSKNRRVNGVQVTFQQL
jgi:hypothetical protein